MQNDIVFQLLTNLTYPFIYRHDRTIYKEYHHLDLLHLFRNAIMASACGYFIGKFVKRRELLYGAMLPIPLVVKFVYDQWRASSTLKQYRDLDFKAREIKVVDVKDKKQQKERINVEVFQWKVVRNLPRLQMKYYNAQDFVGQLTTQYFNPTK